MGRLTTHVLDTARGRPAAGLALALWRIEPNGQRQLVKQVHTNADGRTDEPLLQGEAFTPGTYELIFDVGSYFADYPGVDQPPFLSTVPVRFTVADAAAHYHVPLLASPWSYTTYRGS